MLYSKSTKGFYSPEIHGETIPNDAVEITDAEYHKAKNWAGEVTGIDNEGKMILSPPPSSPPKTRFSAREFLKKLTLQEKLDLKTSDDIQVQLWYDELIAADFVDIEDVDTIAAAEYGVFKGIFSESRKNELLTPE